MNQLTINFTVDGQTQTIQGDPALVTLGDLWDQARSKVSSQPVGRQGGQSSNVDPQLRIGGVGHSFQSSEEQTLQQLGYSQSVPIEFTTTQG